MKLSMKNIISSLPFSKKKRNIANVQDISDFEDVKDTDKNDVEQKQSNSADNDEKNKSKYKESKVKAYYKKTKNYIIILVYTCPLLLLTVQY